MANKRKIAYPVVHLVATNQCREGLTSSSSSKSESSDSGAGGVGKSTSSFSSSQSDWGGGGGGGGGGDIGNSTNGVESLVCCQTFCRIMLGVLLVAIVVVSPLILRMEDIFMTFQVIIHFLFSKDSIGGVANRPSLHSTYELTSVIAATIGFRFDYQSIQKPPPYQECNYVESTGLSVQMEAPDSLCRQEPSVYVCVSVYLCMCV